MRTHDAINGTNIFETAYNECKEVHNMGGVTMENIFAIELEDGDKEKTIEDEVKEILNIKGE